MGDTYTIAIRCAWCGEMNEDVRYAPSSAVESFKCQYCEKPNEIIINFESKKMRDESE